MKTREKLQKPEVIRSVNLSGRTIEEVLPHVGGNVAEASPILAIARNALKARAHQARGTT